MSKLFALIENEWVKQYKKVSVKVILILVLIASFMAPFAIKYFDSSDDIKWVLENYQFNIDRAKSDMEMVDLKAKNAEINKKVLQIEIDKYELLIDKEIQWGEWRSSLVDQVFNDKKLIEVISGIKDEIPLKELLANMYDFDDSLIENYYEMSKDELQKEIDRLTVEINNRSKIIDENDFMASVSAEIATSEKEISQIKSDIKSLEEDIEKNPSNEELKTSLESAKKQLGTLEETLVVNKYRYDNKIPYDKNDWRHNTLEDVIGSIQEKNQELLSEEGFKQQFSYEINRQGYTYAKYQENYEGKINVAKEDLALDWYSLENNIPQVKYIKDARNSLDSTYLFYVSIAIVVCIIVGGGIVSSEYSTGTVRLLMIRPVLRWKILLSKLIAVFLIGYGTIFAGVIVNTISSGILHGFGTLATPVLLIKNGVIIEQNFILTILPKLLFSSISLIFIIAIVFTLSTVLKNTAFAVGLTMAGFLGSMPATIVAAQLGMKWIGKTVLPYVNLTSYVGKSYMVEMLKQQIDINATYGAIHLAVVAVLLIIVSFVVFIKRDVKN